MLNEVKNEAGGHFAHALGLNGHGTDRKAYGAEGGVRLRLEGLADLSLE